MPIDSGPQFLSEKYNLHATEEVSSSVEKLRAQGEKIPETREGRINAHFSRIENALQNKRGLFTHLVKQKVLDAYTLNLQNEDGSEDTEKIDKLVQGLFESEKAILERRGHGAELQQYGDKPSAEDYEKYYTQLHAKKTEQEKTLSVWVDYFASEEASFYPTWFKYLAMRSLQKMGARNRDTNTYSKRSTNTIQPFPDLSREALSLTLTAMKQNDVDISEPTNNQLQEVGEEEQQATEYLEQLANRGDFATLYAHFMGTIEKARREAKEGTRGEWVHFAQGSDPQQLVQTLVGKGTDWCTAGLDVAKSQLQVGEFDIYYTYDQQNHPTIPRIAVYRIDGEISEVRGIYDRDQNIELEFVDIAHQKYREFPGSEKYEKKDRDMKYLSTIQDKMKQKQPLTRDDVVFLYEIDSVIEGFGHEKDPRVAELRKERDPNTDALMVFECTPNQIAHTAAEINNQTKAYIGTFEPGLLNALPNNVEHIYTSFPEGKITRSELMIGGKPVTELENELKQNKINISNYASDMLHSKDFTTLEAPEQISLVRLKVRDLGFTSNPTTDELYAKAHEYGLELCPAETGPYQRLKDLNQPLGQWYSIAMKQITARDGYPDVFDLDLDSDGLWLGNDWANPTDEWYLDRELMFRFRKDSQET